MGFHPILAHSLKINYGNGAYVIGNDWYFMTLEDKCYAFSQDFSAITDDLFTIFRILLHLKKIVKKRFLTQS